MIALPVLGSRSRLDAATSSVSFQNSATADEVTGPETIVDKTPDELIRAMPELAGLEPAFGEKILPGILKRVGENVRAYFRNYLSTSAQEETVQERLRSDGQVEDTFKQEHRYFVVTHPGNGPADWGEYRTDNEGKPADTNVERNAVLTSRFCVYPDIPPS